MWNPVTVLIARKLNTLTSFVNTPPVNKSEQKPRKVLVIHCHPDPKSYSTVLSNCVVESLKKSGHEVKLRRLYLHDDPEQCYNKTTFNPALSLDERREYNDERNALLRGTDDGLKQVHSRDVDIIEAVTDLRWCDSLVLVYPTWWLHLPAVLKGFFDRVFLPGVAFTVPSRDSSGSKSLVGGLGNIDKVGVVTTYGMSRLTYLYVGDNARRFIARGLRPLLGPDCQLLWHGLYEMDFASQQDRERFLAEVSEAYLHF